MEKFTGHDEYENELTNALSARQEGNEGKARVCARRAVGILIREHLRREGIQLVDPSAINRIKYLISMDSIPDDIRETAQHFLVRVSTDQKLPIQVDLIADARWMEIRLLQKGE